MQHHYVDECCCRRAHAKSSAVAQISAAHAYKTICRPLEATTIQRFVDPETGVLCYLYTPYVVSNARDESGNIVYGSNNIGSISCVAPWKEGSPKK